MISFALIRVIRGQNPDTPASAVASRQILPTIDFSGSFVSVDQRRAAFLFHNMPTIGMLCYVEKKVARDMLCICHRFHRAKFQQKIGRRAGETKTDPDHPSQQQPPDSFPMSTTSIAATSTVAAGTIVYEGANKNAGRTTLTSADFMKLMTAQLSAQDPMNPMKDTEFISQMANFTSLENSRTLSESFKSFTTQQSLAAASNFMGRYVTVKDATQGSISGIVDSVVLSGTTPSVVIGGKSYATDLITAIGTPATPATVPPAPAAAAPGN